jgi:hypothetical protein
MMSSRGDWFNIDTLPLTLCFDVGDSASPLGQGLIGLLGDIYALFGSTGREI